LLVSKIVYEYLVGKTIEDIAKDLDMTAPKALMHVMDVTDLRAVVFYKDVNDELLRKTLTHERAFIASHGKGVLQGEFMVHERSSNSFPKYLDIVVGSGMLPVEEAIEKITSKPAEFFGVKNRGVIKEGNVADLVVLDKNDYNAKHVIIGGKVFGQEPTKGEVLRHKI